MFNVSEHDREASTLKFDAGGWQGGRNWQCRDSNGHLSTCEGVLTYPHCSLLVKVCSLLVESTSCNSHFQQPHSDRRAVLEGVRALFVQSIALSMQVMARHLEAATGTSKESRRNSTHPGSSGTTNPLRCNHTCRTGNRWPIMALLMLASMQQMVAAMLVPVIRMCD